MDNAISLNNRLILEEYKTDGGLRKKVSNGFATIEQKSSLKGLRLLVDTVLANGRFARKGDIAYIKEEILHTHAWAKKLYDCDFLAERFMVVDASFVDFLVDASDTDKKSETKEEQLPGPPDSYENE